MHLHARPTHSITVHVIGKRVITVGPAGDFLAKNSLGVAKQPLHAFFERLYTVAANDIMNMAFANVAGRNLRPNIPDRHIWDTHIGFQYGKQRFVRLAATVKL